MTRLNAISRLTAASKRLEQLKQRPESEGLIFAHGALIDTDDIRILEEKLETATASFEDEDYLGVLRTLEGASC